MIGGRVEKITGCYSCGRIVVVKALELYSILILLNSVVAEVLGELLPPKIMNFFFTRIPFFFIECLVLTFCIILLDYKLDWNVKVSISVL